MGPSDMQKSGPIASKDIEQARLVWILRSAKGSACSQGIPASWPRFTICHLIRWFIFPPVRLTAVYKVCAIANQIPITCLFVGPPWQECGPRSDEIATGTPNLGIRFFTGLPTLWDRHGKYFQYTITMLMPSFWLVKAVQAVRLLTYSDFHA